MATKKRRVVYLVKLPLVDHLKSVAEDEGGPDFVREVESFTTNWLDTVLDGRNASARQRWPRATAEPLLRQVFYRYWNDRLSESKTKGKEIIHAERKRYKKLVKAVTEAETLLDLDSFTRFIDSREMFASQESVKKIRNAYRQLKSHKSGIDELRFLTDMHNGLANLKIIAEWLNKKWGSKDMSRSGPRRPDAPYRLARNLLRYLYTVKGKEPRIASTTTMEGSRSSRKGTSERIDNLEFVVEGLSVTGITRGGDRFIRELRADLKKLDCRNTDATLKLIREIPEGVKLKVIRKVAGSKR